MGARMNKQVSNMKRYNIISFYEQLFILILGIVGLSMGVYVFEKEIFYYDDTGMNPYVTGINILTVLIVATFIISFIVKKRNKRKSLLSNGKIVTANFSKDDFMFGVARSHHAYRINGYLVEDGHTYMFQCDVLDRSMETMMILDEIKKRGEFPPLPVLVERGNYNNYEIQAYDFLNETLEMNKEIVEDKRDFLKKQLMSVNPVILVFTFLLLIGLLIDMFLMIISFVDSDFERFPLLLGAFVVLAVALYLTANKES